jgi:hypothetical protein
MLVFAFLEAFSFGFWGFVPFVMKKDGKVVFVWQRRNKREIERREKKYKNQCMKVDTLIFVLFFSPLYFSLISPLPNKDHFSIFFHDKRDKAPKTETKSL